MQLFYFKNASEDGLELDKEQTRHITKVLRKRQGDRISVTNGQGKLFDATLGQVTSNKVLVDLAFAKAEPKPYPPLHIAIAPTKLNDRFEFFLEKACEIGVQTITPILTSNSERKKINHSRFEKILISAMQQSNQLWLPDLKSLTSFNSLITESGEVVKVIAHCEEEKRSFIGDVLGKNYPSLVLIGPEGDFTKQEIEQALQSDFTPVTLGNTRLRTETAGIYAAAIYSSSCR
ncbi:MAG: RsmE family RNA methyltransferase [Nonlabens sp.]